MTDSTQQQAAPTLRAEALEAASKVFLAGGTMLAALEAAAPFMSSHLAAEIEAVEVMIKTAKANGWNEGYATGMDLQVPEPRA